MDDPYENDDAGPTTHVRGYQQLPQDDLKEPRPDPDTEQFTQQKASGNSPLYDPAPAYTPMAPMAQGSQYNPAPMRFPYAPAPQIQQQQQSSNNVVVVNQPSSTSPMIIEENIERAPNDHLVFTICSLVLCCLLGNWFALVCLIPALFLSLAANNANSIRNYAGAKRSANISLCCSLCVYIQFLAVFIIGAVFLAVMFTVGLGFIGVEAPDL